MRVDSADGEREEMRCDVSRAPEEDWIWHQYSVSMKGYPSRRTIRLKTTQRRSIAQRQRDAIV